MSALSITTTNTTTSLLGIVINIGGFPDDGYIGGRFWHNPGAFNNGFKGLCAVFVTAAFAFTGTELVGLAAAETQNPRKSLPTAIKQVFWRITLFYLLALTCMSTSRHLKPYPFISPLAALNSPQTNHQLPKRPLTRQILTKK